MRIFATPFLLLGCLLTSSSAFSIESQSQISPKSIVKKSQLDYTLNFSTKTAGFYEGEDTASQVLLSFSPELKFRFTPNFYIDADVAMNLSSSRVQSRYANHSDSDFALNELSMNILPANFLKLSMGALNQGHLDSPFLVSDISFPGASATIEFQFDNFQAGYKGQQLIPTSSSFDSDRTAKEELPEFQTQGIFANYKMNKAFEISAQYNYYSFNKLPSIVAYQSKRLGNSVTGIEVGDSNFENLFSGISQAYKAKLNYTNSIQQNFLISIVENENTEAGNNRAQILKTQLTFKTASFDIIPGISSFYAEPNVAPAYYNTSRLGHNNREGYEYSLRTNFKNFNLGVELSYIDAKVLNESIYQDDLSSMQLVMEMLNVQF